jgi:MoaA/NifB/PqqE/SkfB family radical SAM enzyme
MLSPALNLLKIAANRRDLAPRMAIYYVTTHCNLNCAYCEDFGARRNPQQAAPLSAEKALRVLRVIRSGVSRLWLTGGEPFTHPNIDEIILKAKKELEFKEISLISNGFLLPQHEAALPALDRLIISLDSTAPEQWSQTIGVPPAMAETILNNIRHYAQLQDKFGYKMSINAVISPDLLDDSSELAENQDKPGSTLQDLLMFCVVNKLQISFSPQSFNNWPRYELMVSPAYRAFIEKLIDLKRRNAPILASELYLKSMLDFRAYDCYPTLIPRIYPNGDLSYPCRPLEKAENGQGGRPVNLLKVKDWAEAWKIALDEYGQPPSACNSCFQQCYAEPSLMAANPLAWFIESQRTRHDLSTYAPG